MLEDEDMPEMGKAGPVLALEIDDEGSEEDSGKPSEKLIGAAKLVRSSMNKGDEALAKALKLFWDSCQPYPMGEE
jgi:hypothetical protein